MALCTRMQEIRSYPHEGSNACSIFKHESNQTVSAVLEELEYSRGLKKYLVKDTTNLKLF